MADRRESPRLEVALDAEYRAEGSPRGGRATLIDLSASGASMVIEEPLRPGSRIAHLTFTLGEDADSHTFGPAAEVVRCDSREGIGRGSVYRIGARFVGLEEAEQGLLSDFILSGLSSEGDAFNPRIDIEEHVAIRFTRFEEFVSEVSRNLSKTGMFIQTQTPKAPGIKFDFVLQLGEDFNLVQGRAEVVWRRERIEGPDRPAGMGVRFLGLDRTSENVLRRLISSHIEPSYPRQFPSRQGSRTGSSELPELLDEPEDLTLS